MFQLITGGSGSGKSAYAESLLCARKNRPDQQRMQNIRLKENQSQIYYIATMIPFGRETEKKIERHRQMRKDKGFETIECYTDLMKMLQKKKIFQEEREKPSVLLECMSNLVANEMFTKRVENREVVRQIIEGIRYLKDNTANLIVVTNEVCSDGNFESDEMDQYKRNLSQINFAMAEMAEQVTEVVYGQPICLKAKNNEIDKSKVEKKDKKGNRMKLVIGGCKQGKQRFANERYGPMNWVDGRECELSGLASCQGIYHFEAFIRRFLKSKEREKIVETLPEYIKRENPELIIVTEEIGYGLVPVDKFERMWREETGRVCTQLAQDAVEVYRVVCGIGMKIKGEKNEIN